MKLSRKLRIVINLVILSISFLVWVLLLINPDHIMTVEHCHFSTSGPSVTSLNMLLAMNPVSGLLTGWTLMVIAMMLPTLIGPIHYIYEKSFKRRRLQSAVLFTFGYVDVWVIVGVLMTGVIIGFNLILPKSYLPAIIIGITAIIWQFSPIKQYCLNRGHNHKPLAAFGRAADRDVLLFGISHGCWCVGSDWVLMLFPMLLPGGHNLAMVIVTFLMISEHYEHPKTPRWRVNIGGRLLRMLLAQVHIKFKQIPI